MSDSNQQAAQEQNKEEATDELKEENVTKNETESTDVEENRHSRQNDNALSLSSSTVEGNSSNENTDDKDSKEGEQLQDLYDTGPMTGSIYADNDLSVDPAMVQALTEGFVSRFLPSLTKAKSTIDQIKTSQNVLLESVQQETARFTECTAINDLEKIMMKARHYHNKLLKLKKEMNSLHEKSSKLKKRALKLQQQKQKEELTRAHNLEKESEKERMLTARVATSSSTSSKS